MKMGIENIGGDMGRQPERTSREEKIRRDKLLDGQPEKILGKKGRGKKELRDKPSEKRGRREDGSEEIVGKSIDEKPPLAPAENLIPAKEKKDDTPAPKKPWDMSPDEFKNQEYPTGHAIEINGEVFTGKTPQEAKNKAEMAGELLRGTSRGRNGFTDKNGGALTDENGQWIDKDMEKYVTNKGNIISQEQAMKMPDAEYMESSYNIKYGHEKAVELAAQKSIFGEGIKSYPEMMRKYRGNAEEQPASLKTSSIISSKAEGKVLDEVAEEQPEDPNALSRKGAMITLGKIDLFDKLNADTVEEGDEKFKAETRKLWREFVTHGQIRPDKETGGWKLDPHSDLDGKCCMGLLDLALKEEKSGKKKGLSTRYVMPGDYIDGKTMVDTGRQHGLVIKDKNGNIISDTLPIKDKDGNIMDNKSQRDITVFIDHHAPESRRDSSATKFTYELLASLGLLKKEGYLDKMVEFVTQADNKTFPDQEKYFKDSHRMLLGLERFAQFEDLKKFFEDGHSPIEKLSPGLLKKYKFIVDDKGVNRSEQQKESIDSSLKQLEKIEKEGFIIDSARYGKIVVDINGQIRSGYDAVRAWGGNVYIIWNKPSESFFISSKNDIADDLKQGENQRGGMWIKPRHDKAPLTVTLEEILTTMTDGQFNPTGELKEFIEKERQTKIASEAGGKANEPEDEDDLNKLFAEEPSGPGANATIRQEGQPSPEILTEEEKLKAQEELQKYIDDRVSAFRRIFAEKNLPPEAANPWIEQFLINIKNEERRDETKAIYNDSHIIDDANTAAQIQGLTPPGDSIEHQSVPNGLGSGKNPTGKIPEKPADQTPLETLSNEEKLKAQEELQKHIDDLITKISPEIAQEIVDLCKEKNFLTLNLGRLEILTPEIAEILITFSGDRLLFGIKEISPETATVLKNFKGIVEMRDLEKADEQTIEILAQAQGDFIYPASLQKKISQKKQEGQLSPETLSNAEKLEAEKELEKVESELEKAERKLSRSRNKKTREETKKDINRLKQRRTELNIKLGTGESTPPVTGSTPAETVATTQEQTNPAGANPETAPAGVAPELAEAAAQAQEQIDLMSKKDKKTLFEGLANLGFRTTELKSKVFSKIFHGIAGKTDKDKKNVVANFFDNFANIYDKMGAQAKRQRETVGKGKLSRLSGTGQGAGNLFRYGRIVYDAVTQFSGRTLNPFRHVTAAAMLIGRTSSAVKETRLGYESAKEKTRAKVGNISISADGSELEFESEEDKKNYERAADEAWKIYEKAKQENGEVNAKDLDKAYRDNLPQDILDRLNRFDGKKKSFALGVFEALLNKDIKPAVERMKKNLEEIENGKLSAKEAEKEAWKIYNKAKQENGEVTKENLDKAYKEEKEKKIQDLLRRNELFLNDLDRIVGDQGTLDQIAYWSRMGEVVGKDVANVLIVDSVGRLAYGGVNVFHATEKFLHSGKPAGHSYGKINENLRAEDMRPASHETAQTGRGSAPATPESGSSKGLGSQKSSEIIHQATDKATIAGKFGLTADDLKNINKDVTIDNNYIAKIQESHFGPSAHFSEPLAKADFDNLNTEKDAIITLKILGHGQPTKMDLDVLKAKDLPRNMRLAFLDGPDTDSQAENLKDIQKINSSDPNIIKRLDSLMGGKEVHGMAKIPKGGNISEALGVNMTQDALVHVINPDGTLVMGDANLVHSDDTLVQMEGGDIYVLKTSEIEVGDKTTLGGLYDKIEADLRGQKIPQRVQDVFNANREEGGFLGRIDKNEAKVASEFWKEYGGRIGNLDQNQKANFYEHTNLHDSDNVKSNLDMLEKQSAQQRELTQEKMEELSGKTPVDSLGEKIITEHTSPKETGVDVQKQAKIFWQEKSEHGAAETKPTDISHSEETTAEPQAPAEKIAETPPIKPELKIFTGHENLDQKSYGKVINNINQKGLSIEQNNQIILRDSREISILKNDLETLKLNPEETRMRLDRIREIIQTEKNTYGVDVFNKDIKDFVNDYKIPETPADSKPDVSPAPGIKETVPTRSEAVFTTKNEKIYSNFKNIMGRELGLTDLRQNFCFNVLLGKNNTVTEYYLKAEQAGNGNKALENIKDYFRWALEPKNNNYVKAKNIGLARVALEIWAEKKENMFNPDKNYSDLLKKK